MNSPLVEYVKYSPNHDGKRANHIDRITPHCVVGQCSIEGLGDVFLPPKRKASSNYGIGTDGRVGLFVDEDTHSWCSSSWANDDRAVTIECASDKEEPYAFNQVVYRRLIDLCVDICQRNGKKKLLWLKDKNKTLAYQPAKDEMILTVHRWFAPKSCPGEWMYTRMGDLANQVTARLQNPAPGSATSGNTFYRVQIGSFATAKAAENYARICTEALRKQGVIGTDPKEAPFVQPIAKK